MPTANHSSFPKDPEFRIRLETRDGQLVANRMGTRSCWYTRWGFDKRAAEIMLHRDCVEKGVRLISYTHDEQTGITAIVEWLSARS